MKTGPLETAIHRAKAGNWGWGMIFARVVLGYLYDNRDVVNDLDAIIPTPAFLEPGEDVRNDHARRVIEQAALQDDYDLPFVYQPPLITKRQATRRMRLTTSVTQRSDVAKDLYAALHVPDRRAVVGRRIMVYDDVFTTGTTLNTVARRLREAGAASVRGLALARQPWGR